MVKLRERGAGEGGGFLIKVGTDVQAWALGISGVNFCLGIRFWEVNFAWALDFWQFLTKNVIIDKRVKKVTYLLKIFDFGTLKVMNTCPVIRFLSTFLSGLGFALVAHPYLPLLGSRPPPPHKAYPCSRYRVIPRDKSA